MRFTKSFSLALRFALREMRGGLSGFYIFLACIALGVAAIGGVNSVARSVSTGIASEGQSILGGDMSFSLNQREASTNERAFIEQQGRFAESATMRSMARIPDGTDQSLVEVKAVDAAYPLYGELKVQPQQSLADMTKEQDGTYGAAVSQDFLNRMGLSLGAKVLLGSETFELRALIESEPDLLSSGFNFAPRFLVSMDGLRASGLIQPGSLVDHIYKVALPDGAPDSAIAQLRERAGTDFPDAGWNIRSRANAAPALSANIERFSQFLTLVGLTALIVGGVGVANAVRAYLDGKRGVIATFKSLGAPARFAVLVYLVQIMVIGLIGIAIGLVLATIMPFAAAAALANYLPVAGGGGFFPDALALAAVFGLITTLAFAIIPLGRARNIPATALFREQGFEQRGFPPFLYLSLAVLLIAALAGLALYVAYDRRIAAIFIVSSIAAFGVLRLVADAIRWLARRAPRMRSTAVRLAVGNIHRPGALTPSVVLSLGLGLTLMVAIALIDGNLRRQVTENIPAQAPDFFFVDIQNNDIGDFTKLVSGIVPDGKLTSGPMLRGRIVAFNGTNVRDMTIPPEAAWVLRGDRGITFADKVPENSTLTEGAWWPTDYSGEPLVSFAEREGKELGLKLGDTVTVNVLGRNINAKIASFRQLQWETLAMNFVMVFSPNTFAGAPATWLATLTIPDGQKNLAPDVLRQVTKTWPAITTVSVTDALDVANDLISQLATAIRAAASIALAASVLVLGGALAAGNRARVHDAVVLKTLGATRGTLIAAYIVEYMLLGLATAVFALVAGSAAGWYVVVEVMKLKAQFLPDVALMTVAVALVLTVGFGLAGTWRVLGQKPATVLRTI
ncbi:ABC transporter permease [Ochrobactrum quorumnocens]|uniref:ABC transporter permease n=1 Tax=Ochrobactrum quorumnocens TaxID=271865 RepID=A0A5N1JTZ8_9HYPH|nr:ABC transporter permease [[Ochrobactrum] quorumnocens]KAA9361177.1 ABC transporter permease [[Ochrobactrum] quorumnocens]MBD7993305.1 ABC transporter permease [Ochrobactrum gallinarum]